MGPVADMWTLNIENLGRGVNARLLFVSTVQNGQLISYLDGKVVPLSTLFGYGLQPGALVTPVYAEAS
jgi:hypothetical protein